LVGIPFLLVIGLLADLQPEWVAGGVFAVCVAELIADMSWSDGVIGEEPLMPDD